jgi:hypothetical protein
MDRPEVSEQQFNVRVFQAVGQRTKIDLVNGDGGDNNYSYDESNFGSGVLELDPQVQRSPFTSASIGSGVTIIPSVELSVRIGDEDYKLSVKYQFDGESTEQAKGGNFSQALSVGANYYSENESHENNFNDDYKWDQETSTFDLAWILGYRFNQRHLLYGGPFLIKGSLKGQQAFVKRNLDDEIIFTGDSLQLNSEGKAVGLNIAYEYKRKSGMFYTLEYSRMNMEWGQSKDASNSLNFMAGWQF